MKTTIKSLSEEERPREKMIARGCSSLTDAELLAIVLRNGVQSKNALELARELLGEAEGKLRRLAGFSLDRLRRTGGVGTAKAVTVAATFEIARRFSAEAVEEFPIIDSPAKVVSIMEPLLSDLPHEECWILYLNRAHKLFAKEKVSLGGVSQTTIDIKIIVKKAVEKLASGIILVHNHPSGNRFPSSSDREQTVALRKAAEMFDIHLNDHIIIAGKKYFSFLDENY